MKYLWLVVAITLIAASNAWVLIQVGMNRSGALEAELVLSERELAYYGTSSEVSTVALHLRWQNTAPEWRQSPGAALSDRGWFNQEKLEAIGFDCGVPLSSPHASSHYRQMPSRPVYVALEFDGDSWRQWLKAREPALAFESGQYARNIPFERRLEIESRTESRLVAIDAARYGHELRGKYPDRNRVLILRGVAKVVFQEVQSAAAGQPGRPAFLRGAITKLSGEVSHVPLPYAKLFDPAYSYVLWTYTDGQVQIREPRYSIALRTGSRFEPWIADVRMTTPPKAEVP